MTSPRVSIIRYCRLLSGFRAEIFQIEVIRGFTSFSAERMPVSKPIINLSYVRLQSPKTGGSYTGSRSRWKVLIKISDRRSVN